MNALGGTECWPTLLKEVEGEEAECIRRDIRKLRAHGNRLRRDLHKVCEGRAPASREEWVLVWQRAIKMSGDLEWGVHILTEILQEAWAWDHIPGLDDLDLKYH